MGKIKNIMKRIIPVSWHHMDYRIREVEKSINKVGTDVGIIADRLNDVWNQAMESNVQYGKSFDNQSEIIKKNFDKQTEVIEKSFSEIQDKLQLSLQSETESIKKLHELETHIHKLGTHIQRKVFYNNDFERKVIVSFYDITERPDFKEKYLRLVKNLDPQSIENVVRILKRQQAIKGTEGLDLDIWVREEQEAIRVLKEDFEALKFKIADDLYCYKNYLLPVNHFEASVFYDRHGLEMVENLEYVRNKDIIDVGGFIGDSVLVLAPLTNRKVYSFEAIAENYNIMQKTVELNGIRNAVPERLALGAEKGVITVNFSDSCSSVNTPLASKTLYQEEVKVVTLDSYVDKFKLEVGLIKVDIEGFEQQFLKGAEKTIKEQKPVMLLSIYHNADDFFNIKPIIESWDLGYRFKIYKPKDYSISREVLLICEVKEK